MIGLPAAYAFAGVLFAAFALACAVRPGRPRRGVTTAFLALLAVSFLAGDRLGDLGNGVLVLVLVGLGVRELAPAPAPGAIDAARRKAGAARHGDRLFLLALVVPLVAVIGALTLKNLRLGGAPLVDPKAGHGDRAGPWRAVVLLTALIVLRARYANIALGHVRCEYPKKLDHMLDGEADALTPRALHPIFHDSFDWHSCVHSYWMLATLLRLYPDGQAAPRIVGLFDEMLTEDKIAGELAYLVRPSSRGFERPYGWAWFLALQVVLEALSIRSSRRMERWAVTLRPLADAFEDRFKAFLPLADYPIRTGSHANTAFALRVAFGYAQAVEDGTSAAPTGRKKPPRRRCGRAGPRRRRCYRHPWRRRLRGAQNVRSQTLSRAQARLGTYCGAPSLDWIG